MLSALVPCPALGLLSVEVEVQPLWALSWQRRDATLPCGEQRTESVHSDDFALLPASLVSGYLVRVEVGSQCPQIRSWAKPQGQVGVVGSTCLSEGICAYGARGGDGV